MRDLAVLGVDRMERVLRTARRIAVLGVKPESRSELDAHQIPLCLQKVGYEIIPVPTRYPEAHRILGVPVRRRLSEVQGPMDVVNVFCKPSELAAHADDLLRVHPPVVWFQSGLLLLDVAMALIEAGCEVAEDCIGCRRASMTPSVRPFDTNSR